ncbi:DSBA-like thioredoxin domain-containing protein [Colletotrichum karsti]|uniref:DSBA-like thioredoxin domain-containing protein n=1 Tax=Colletotrichum karsti TaxID=1095194 RepID=A0A9P6LIU4_9PEZI|nr:DSBA-like thioredoxin domain-containing protein [Colletotrichum karsti]KAF9875008.1 DSBA-like thioredoxin domain-containing protein [Colletotrichum karsti]
MSVIQIEVIFDFVCAWCYIGKRKLDQAIALYQKTYPGGKNDVFSVTWRPYYLNYNPSSHSVDKSELAKTRLTDMSPERQAALTKRMEQIGRSVGIAFRWGGQIGPDTRDAHRLVRLTRSKAPEIQDALIEKLFGAYQELEKDISNKDILRQIAIDVGLDDADVEQLLASSSGLDEVDEEEKKTRDLAAGSGVPTFIIQGIHKLDEAQDSSDFYEVFMKVKEVENETL